MRVGKKRKIKVLVVDNEKGFASLLVDHLNLRQMEATSAGSGEEALTGLPSFQPDVMILDLQMPDMDGLKVLARVKELEPAVEVILLTGNGSFDTGIACMLLGAFDYLVKPVDIEQLIEIIAGACQKKLSGR